MTTQTNFTRTAIILFLILANTSGFAQFWSKKGDSGTDPSINFIGTTDNVGLRIQTNNISRINISSGGNVGIGSSHPAFKFDVGGGSINTDSGYRINGILVLSNAGFYNIFTGKNAGAFNTTGHGNSFYGSDAGKSNTLGHENTANGYKAFYSNTSGGSNTAIGSNTLYFNSNGYANTANGAYSLRNNTTGDFNTASGYSALISNTTGEYNIATGVAALYSNINGSRNTANGVNALSHNTFGSKNTANGYQALYNNTFGIQNVAIGYNAFTNNTTGSNNTVIGSFAGPGAGEYSNFTAIGYQTFISASNQVRIGNQSVTSIGGNVNWTTLSDGRVKKNIKENVPGLEFIKALKPVTYNLNITGLETYLHKPMATTDKNTELLYQATDDDRKAIAEKEKVIYSGFVAQDVERAAKQLGYDFSGVDAPKNDGDVYGLRYAEFVMPLVKAVQELSAENDELKSRLNKIEKLLAHSPSGQTPPVSLSDARLGQNIPNPFHQNTSVKYFLPQNAGNAFIKVTGINGQLVKTIAIKSKGDGQVELQTGNLTPGTYQYSFIVDGKLVETRKMIVL